MGEKPDEKVAIITRSAFMDLLERAEAAEAKVAKVEALHPRGETWYDPGDGMVTTDDDRIEDGCQSCRVPWPCPTAAVLADAPTEQTKGGE